MRLHDIRKLIPAVLALALSLSALVPAASLAATGITLGTVAPDFTKTQLSGGSISLSDYRGKVVLLFLLGYS